MKKLITIITILASLSSCDFYGENPFESDNGDIFIIKKGTHSSSRSPESIEKNVLSFTARFDSTAIYQTKDSLNQLDINKLMGFSDCGGHHHENSARFGWRWHEDNIEIFAYYYQNGNRFSELLGTADLINYHDYSLEKLDDKYVFTFDDTVFETERSNCGETTNYMLFPYFGGDETAPHDIVIKILRD